MITEYEKVKALKQSQDLASILVNNDEGPLYYKIFANFFAKSYPNKSLSFDESVFRDNTAMISSLTEMLQYMVQVASESTSQKLYSTGQLAKYFGVSVTSINNWISKDRFVGIERSTRHKQMRIPENTMWRSSQGELIPVREVVEMWEEEHSLRLNLNRQDELTALEMTIKVMEEKYGGPYEKTLGLKEEMTVQETQDKMEWEYLLKRVADDQSTAIKPAILATSLSRHHSK